MLLYLVSEVKFGIKLVDKIVKTLWETKTTLCSQVIFGIRSNYLNYCRWVLISLQQKCEDAPWKPTSLWLNILIQCGPSQLQFASDRSLSKTHSKKRHNLNFSNADTSDGPPFRVYPTCILFRVKSWPCVTFHACFLSSKQYYRLYAWSTWNHYQTWVVMALLWKSFWFCIYAAIFMIVYWSWYNSYEHHAHSVLKKKVLLGPGHFPKLKIPLYQKAPAISYQPLSQLHTDDLLSFELLYKAATPFEQPNKQKKKMGRKAGFLQSCRKMVSQEWAWDWNRSNMPFGYVLLMSHDSKIEPLFQCEIKEVKPGAYSLYRMGRYCSWSFLLFLWGRRAWLWGRIYKCVQCIDSMCIHPIQDILYIVYICVWTWTYMNTDTLKKKTRWLVLYQFS